MATWKACSQLTKRPWSLGISFFVRGATHSIGSSSEAVNKTQVETQHATSHPKTRQIPSAVIAAVESSRQPKRKSAFTGQRTNWSEHAKLSVETGEGHFKIKYISVIAERHSGSTWMYHFLRKYFARKDLRVVPTLCTWKHWFQDRMHRDIQEGTRICRNTQPCPGCKDANHTLVVAMWRNPYDWITAMSQYPHHAEAHFGLRYNLSAFMTKRWMLEPQKEMKARDEARLKDPVKDPCMDNFLPWEVLPCSPQNRDAIYELDSDGGAYDNIYALRKAKIEDFNAVESWVRLYERVRYEDVLHVEGLKKWLGSLESKYGLVGDETVMPGKTVASQMQTKLSEMFYVNSKHCMPHCEMGSSASGQEAVRTLHTLFDDELEGSVGYTRVPEDRD